MDDKPEFDCEGARVATEAQITVLLHEVREDILLGLLENPRLNEGHLCLLLARMDLSTVLLNEIARHDEWRQSYRVRRSLAFHPHVSQTLGLQLVRELFVTDLAQLVFAPSGAPVLRRLAEELVLIKLAQLPSSQKIILARRGSPRIAGALLADGSPETLPVVLESPLLNEGQVLRVLARIAVPDRVVKAIALHARWSNIYSIRLALLRTSKTPLARVLAFLPGISTSDLQALIQSSAVPSMFLPHVRRALANRPQGGRARH
jgi:hypothetical protein